MPFIGAHLPTSTTATSTAMNVRKPCQLTTNAPTKIAGKEVGVDVDGYHSVPCRKED